MLKEEKFAVGSLERSEKLSKGLARLAEGGIDAVLLDLGLPDSQGLGTFEKVHSAAEHVPIVILTGFDDDALALEAVRRGAQDYLIKGKFDGALLVRAISYAVERKKLAEAVKKQAELIDLSPDAIIIKKPDDTVTFWSLGAEKLYGYTKAQAVGQKTQVLFKTKSVQSLESVEAQLKQEGKWSGELLHQTKLGRELAIQSYWLAKFDERLDIAEIFESNVDITERKNAERLAAIGATAGMVGHDIRNPLQAIVGDLYLAKSDLASIPEGEEKEGLKESLAAIEKSVEYIDKIIQDLQDFAKPLNPSLRETDFEELCQDVLLTNHLPENIDASFQVEEEAKKLISDPALLRRILSNLVNNAVQAMPEGGKLEIRAYHNADTVVITVKDTGIGIPEEVKPKLFTPLFTTKSKGQGFGLAIVKRMTEALGGTVTFESEEGKGTKFIVRIPSEKVDNK